MALVEAGLGVSILPSLILSRCPFDVAILPLEPRAYRDIYVTHRPQAELSRATRDFLRHLGQSLGAEGEGSEP
jgi:DNA-binding transcriptional LysR family regulator